MLADESDMQGINEGWIDAKYGARARMTTEGGMVDGTRGRCREADIVIAVASRPQLGHGTCVAELGLAA